MKIELTELQLNIVMAGLNELPRKHSDDVVRTIIEQVSNQIPDSEPPAPNDNDGE